MMQVYATNEAYHEPLAPIFEISRTYGKEGGGYSEKTLLAGLHPGGFADAKGTLQVLLGDFGVEVDVVPQDVPGFVRGQACRLGAEGALLGFLGQLDLKLFRGLSLPSVGAFELDFDALNRLSRLERRLHEIPRQAPVRRDLAFVLDRSVRWSVLEQCVRKASPAHLEKVELFDVYQGKGIPDGKKSLAFTLVFRSPDRPLKGEEVDTAVRTVVTAVSGTLGGILRGNGSGAGQSS
jgi:phenylalanyl-tRNA synthetase beta chain